MNLQLTKETFRFNKILFFGLLCLYYCLNTYILSELVITKEIYYQSYSEQITYEQIDAYVETMAKWQWIGYVFIPITLLIKIGFVAFCLNIGTLLAGIKIEFKKLFQIVLIAHLTFAIASLTKGIWLLFFKEINTLQDAQLFYPLSLLTFFPPDKVEPWFIYPMQTINLFELAYWFIIAKGLKMVLNNTFSNALKLVASSYGLGLLVWMVIVVFLSINFS